MNKQSILLISFGQFENYFLEEIAGRIEKVFHYPVLVQNGHIDLSEYYDPMRRQYDGNSILKEVDSIISDNVIKKIGLFRVDLFIPILTYIFGQAAFQGTAGIASLYRLRNERYGMDKDENLLLERFTKVVIHEMGHTFGLIHCHHPKCVMRSSTYVEDIDQKSIEFCYRCSKTISLE